MEEYSSKVKTAVIIAASLTSFLTPFMGASIVVALPQIGTEFGMSAVMISWVSSIYLLASAMFLVPFGKIADIYGRKRIFFWGLIVYIVSTLLCGLAPNGLVLIIARALQGIGSAMVFGTGTAIITSVIPPSERGRVIGINIATVYLSLSLGPWLGGMLTHNFGWRSLFLSNIPLALIAVYFVSVRLTGEWAEDKGQKIDYKSSFIYMISLAGIMYGFTKLTTPIGAILFSLGLVLFIIFIYYQSKAANPLININLFRTNTIFAFSNLAALINYSATFAVTFLLSFYLQYIKLMNPQQAGSILVAQPIVMALFSPLAGRLSDKIDSRIIASIGMILTVIGLTFIVFLNEQTSLGYIIMTLLVLGLGFALFSSPNTNAVMSSVERRHLGLASATLGTMRLIGQVLSMGIAMLIISIFVGNVKLQPANHKELMDAIRVCFTIFTVLCIIGVFSSLARGKRAEVKH